MSWMIDNPFLVKCIFQLENLYDSILFGSACELYRIFYFYYLDAHGNLLEYFHIL